MDKLDLLQWPAMAVTLAAAWLIASNSKGRRNAGFWLFLTSNLLWAIWGFASHAYALILLQFGLAAMNIRGALKTEGASDYERTRRPQDEGRLSNQVAAKE